MWVLSFWVWISASMNWPWCWYSDAKWKVLFLFFLMPDLKTEVMPTLSAFNCASFTHEWIFYPLHHYQNIWTDKYIVCGMGNEAIGPWSLFFWLFDIHLICNSCYRYFFFFVSLLRWLSFIYFFIFFLSYEFSHWIHFCTSEPKLLVHPMKFLPITYMSLLIGIKWDVLIYTVLYVHCYGLPQPWLAYFWSF